MCSIELHNVIYVCGRFQEFVGTVFVTSHNIACCPITSVCDVSCSESYLGGHFLHVKNILQAPFLPRAPPAPFIRRMLV